MKSTSFLLSIFLIFFFFTGTHVMNAQKASLPGSEVNKKPKAASELVVLWTSGDPEVAKKMVFMYVYNAMKAGWWEDITFIIWGPSSRLLAGDKTVQAEIKKMKEVGINLVACKACADEYGVSGKLADLGIDVKYMGKPLTKYIKEQGYHVITF
jgi:hypothetical protein